MDQVYSYIANSNPAGAKSVLTSFGYVRTKNTQGLGNDLKTLVAMEGEPALNSVMDLHPDKEIILEMFSVKPKAKKCTNCQNAYLNAAGPAAMSQAAVLGNQGSTFILAAALILAVAIIAKN